MIQSTPFAGSDIPGNVNDTCLPQSDPNRFRAFPTQDTAPCNGKA